MSVFLIALNIETHGAGEGGLKYKHTELLSDNGNQKNGIKKPVLISFTILGYAHPLVKEEKVSYLFDSLTHDSIPPFS